MWNCIAFTYFVWIAYNAIQIENAKCIWRYICENEWEQIYTYKRMIVSEDLVATLFFYECAQEIEKAQGRKRTTREPGKYWNSHAERMDTFFIWHWCALSGLFSIPYIFTRVLYGYTRMDRYISFYLVFSSSSSVSWDWGGFAKIRYLYQIGLDLKTPGYGTVTWGRISRKFQWRLQH